MNRMGSDDQIENTVAKVIIDELRLSPELIYSCKYSGGTAWTGNVKYVLLSTEKLRKIGWKINHSSEEAVRLTARIIIRKGNDDNNN